MTLPNLACYFKNASNCLISENLDLLNDNSLDKVSEESLDELEMRLDSTLDILNFKLRNKFEFKSENEINEKKTYSSKIKRHLKEISQKKESNKNNKYTKEESFSNSNEKYINSNKSDLNNSIYSKLSTSFESISNKDVESDNKNNMTGIKRKNDINISCFEIKNMNEALKTVNKPDYAKVISFLEKYS